MCTRRNVVAVVALCSLFTTFAAAEGPREPARPLAEVAISASRVDWQPAAEHERLVLTVAGPEGLYIQREFGAGEEPFLSAQESALPDGVYAYELRAVPAAKGREAQWGHVWVQAGSFVDKVPVPLRPAKPNESASKPRNITADTTITDDLICEEDLIVEGHACIGGDCTAAGTAPLMIKEFANYQIVFDGQGNHPAERKWAIQANDFSATVGDFLFRDLSAGTIPFRIGSGVPDNALTVFPFSGNIGVGTLTPAVRLDVKANAAGLATERLQNSSATGYSGTEYLDNAGNVDLFLGVDNAASTTRLNSMNNNPIVVLTNSTERMRVTSTGSVGVGTSTPATQFHMRGTDAGSFNKILVENAGTGAARELLEIRNNGGAVFVLENTSVSERWALGTVSSSIVFDNQANAGTEVTISNTGNVTIAGTLTQGSDRATKEAIIPVEPEEVLAKLVSLPISTWSRKDEDPKVRHLGPMAQDFSAIFGLGEDNRRIAPLDMAGVSMASIQALHGMVTRTVAEKDAEIAVLRERLAILEELVSKLAAPQ